jgi:hypothetical protein
VLRRRTLWESTQSQRILMLPLSMVVLEPTQTSALLTHEVDERPWQLADAPPLDGALPLASAGSGSTSVGAVRVAPGVVPAAMLAHEPAHDSSDSHAWTALREGGRKVQAVPPRSFLEAFVRGLMGQRMRSLVTVDQVLPLGQVVTVVGSLSLLGGGGAGGGASAGSRLKLTAGARAGGALSLSLEADPTWGVRVVGSVSDVVRALRASARARRVAALVSASLSTAALGALVWHRRHFLARWLEWHVLGRTQGLRPEWDRPETYEPLAHGDQDAADLAAALVDDELHFGEAQAQAQAQRDGDGDGDDAVAAQRARAAATAAAAAARAAVVRVVGAVVTRADELVIADDAPGGDCVICAERERRILFLPCRHFATCIRCARAVMSDRQPEAQRRRCPVCRADVTLLQRVYVA